MQIVPHCVAALWAISNEKQSTLQESFIITNISWFSLESCLLGPNSTNKLIKWCSGCSQSVCSRQYKNVENFEPYAPITTQLQCIDQSID
ncbi:hypothetical protein BpHYR1_051776 [Brachionus plicatilis]|uniref:Uncharacterized protein n=1 Tax=Brachionus plicatilis TaxID=10195 RepID=A0A3M7R6V9_BRAPC|nr:hypothetical protein BpHYR1_051776 [Brachionus plicatilis]